MIATRAQKRALQGRAANSADGHGMEALTGITATPLPGAACLTSGLSADTWFGGPAGANQHDRDNADRHARAVCATCPAIAACLTRALDNREQYGMFGGLTADERKAIRRGRIGPGSAVIAALLDLEDAGGDVQSVLDVIAQHRAGEAA